MSADDSRDRVVALAYGVLILLSPAVILVLTLGFLTFTGDLVLGRVTPLEFLELYIIELVVLAGFGYGLYRLTLRVAQRRLPVVLDALDVDEVPEDQDGDGEEEE
jgi:hypothetical protein